MFNLLPQEQKKKIRQNYLRRFAIVTIISGILLTIIFCVALIPAYVASSQKVFSAQERKQIIENSISSSDKGILQAQLTELKTDVEILQKKNISTVGLVQQIIINKGPGISISGFMLTTGSTGEKRFVVEGIADSREKLKQFQANVLAMKFKKVDLPISSFAKDKDIAFTMTITISNE